MSFITLILFAIGLVLLIVGAEALVRGASRLAAAVGISPLVIGLTVVAYGTSAPELAVSVQSSYAGVADLAVGNVVGSNIANVLLILGLSASIAPLMVAQQLIRLDVPLMIGLSVLLLLFGLDGGLDRWEGALLTAGAVAYTVFAVYQSRKESKAVQAEYAQTFGQPSLEPNEAQKSGAGQLLLQLLLIGVGIGLLVLGANWLVNGAVQFAQFFGVSELVIGLTVVAIGTSLPELATSVVASLKGERDIAVGNIVGSNIFNILTVLGLSGLVAPSGIPISPAALAFDIPVMIAVAVVCLPIFFTGGVIARWEGVLFLGYYIAYTAYLVLVATRPELLPEFRTVMVWGVLPLTVITLLISLFWTLQLKARQNLPEFRE